VPNLLDGALDGASRWVRRVGDARPRASLRRATLPDSANVSPCRLDRDPSAPLRRIAPRSIPSKVEQFSMFITVRTAPNAVARALLIPRAPREHGAPRGCGGAAWRPGFLPFRFSAASLRQLGFALRAFFLRRLPSRERTALSHLLRFSSRVDRVGLAAPRGGRAQLARFARLAWLHPHVTETWLSKGGLRPSTHGGPGGESPASLHAARASESSPGPARRGLLCGSCREHRGSPC